MSGPAHASPQQARIVSVVQESDTRAAVWVHSAAMNKNIKVFVLTPRTRTGPRPTLYLLDGAGARGHNSGWREAGGVEEFFADKDVNVVLPTGAYGTFYADWERRDPTVGKPMWETFLTKELPPLIDARFDTTGSRGIAGVSMGGQAAFTLAIRAPALYRAVASISGCPPVSTAHGESYVRATLARGGANADNMWGQTGSRGWRDHDPARHLDRLRGKALYLYSGAGRLGPADIKRNVSPEEGLYQVVLAASSAFEIATSDCSQRFAGQLRAAGLPFTDAMQTVGTHHWYYWAKELPRMWKAIEPSL
ncbi:alpha/beta hydrolase family protein [Gordonia amicalis]|uniref:Alpha/beta hydrolase family protein n=1 Tax=Gordonia amicalis TaxID=89053 RepID=A0ABU4DAW7_9ACTN|nr:MULTISPECIES: alpha/beta hydrolase family protein [Gordonia]MCZ0912263.1 alpha/beta hydrolase family protein [Gordonia amicalis]MDJ0454168.1 alpha/beta hydrolase family protein [Gordonia amicalis]MDV6306820.1 alpha/beta hydrolase family protein [Gordonia amicalis]MDV7077312.1 alpha/beta hydrolase family protein [Gordonia amicalis]MDV7099134.1 alpha/beta hydrolase family protein [Gordonia amicalis]